MSAWTPTEWGEFLFWLFLFIMATSIAIVFSINSVERKK